MKKRILSIFMIVVCFVSSFSPSFVVYAEDVSYDGVRRLIDEEGQLTMDDYLYYLLKGDSDALNYLYYAFSNIVGFIPDTVYNAASKIADFFTAGSYSDFVALSRVNGNITFTPEFIDFLRDATNNYLLTEAGYYPVPGIPDYSEESGFGFPTELDQFVSLYVSLCHPSYTSVSGFTNEAYENFKNFFDSNTKDSFLHIYLTSNSSYIQLYTSAFSTDYYYIYGAYFSYTSSYLTGFDSAHNYNLHQLRIDYGNLVNGYWNSFNGTSGLLTQESSRLYSRGEDKKVFLSLSKMAAYYNGNKPAYISSAYYNNIYNIDYNKYSNIKETNIYNYNWETINNTLYDSVKDSDNGISEPELQKIIDGYSKEITDALEDVNEGIIDNGEKLDDLITQISTSGERQSSWLAKIYNYLCEILPVIADGSGSSGSGVSDQAVTDRLDSIISLLEDNLDILEDIEGNTADIRTLLALDDAENSFFDLMAYKLQTSESVMKERFPTSIPWDVMMVVAAFAEEPEAPVFDIPIKVQSLGVQETIHIDLSESSTVSDFSKLSKISRTILSITFLLFLIILTKNLFGGDD